MKFQPKKFYKKLIACSVLAVLASLYTPSLIVTAEDTEAAELNESLSEVDLRELIQPFSRFKGDPVYEMRTLVLAFDDLLNSPELSLLTREDIHRLMDEPSMTQQVAESVIDTYQAKADLHTVEIHFVFEDEYLLLIQRDEHEPSLYQTLKIDSETRQKLQGTESLSLNDLVAILGPPSTSWYYVLKGETIFIWQSMIQSDLTALVVAMDKEGNLKFTYLPE